MLKNIVTSLSNIGEKLSIKYVRPSGRNVPHNHFLPDYHGGEFRPDLKQDFSIFDVHVPQYTHTYDYYRVYMPFRRTNNIEENTKYVSEIISSINKYTEYIEDDSGNKLSNSEVCFKELKPYLNEILHDLSTKIVLKEHKLRYQTEQGLRFNTSIKKFTGSMYSLKTKSVEDFILDYNRYIWNEIKTSHHCLSPKIEASYRGNYHTIENSSAVDDFVLTLSSSENSIKRCLSNMLKAAYRNPHKDLQVKI